MSYIKSSITNSISTTTQIFRDLLKFNRDTIENEEGRLAKLIDSRTEGEAKVKIINLER